MREASSFLPTVRGRLRSVVLAFGLIAIPIASISLHTPGNALAQASGIGSSKTRAPMSEPSFWSVVESTTTFEADSDRQLAALQAALRRLSIEDLEAYEATFDALMKRSYSWDLWGATYVIHGGASDDGFEYFRCWLISKGRTVFEKVLADPDSLADLLAPDLQGVLEFELFAYVARRTWGEKTGRPATQIPTAANMMYPGTEPSGVRFEDDPTHLAKRYPKLWRRFGHAPLG